MRCGESGAFGVLRNKSDLGAFVGVLVANEFQNIGSLVLLLKSDRSLLPLYACKKLANGEVSKFAGQQNHRAYRSYRQTHVSKMKNTLKALCLTGVICMTSCSTKYYEYSGDAVILGNGGASKKVDGIDIWVDGTPPRKFQIIGFIEDSRPGRGPAMAARNRALASKAKEHGGDAVLLRDVEKENLGAFNTGSAIATSTMTAFGSGILINATRKNSKFYVIRYLKY